jgi:hypothetical protein
MTVLSFDSSSITHSVPIEPAETILILVCWIFVRGSATWLGCSGGDWYRDRNRPRAGDGKNGEIAMSGRRDYSARSPGCCRRAAEQTRAFGNHLYAAHRAT